MKLNIKHIPVAGALAIAALSMGSCTDKLAFGNSFLDKAPGGTVTADTIFSNAEYTRNFLAQAYAYQYYNLPVGSSNSMPQFYNYFRGPADLLDDTHTCVNTSVAIVNTYYTGMLTSSGGNAHVFPYNNMHIWENVRSSYLLLDRVDEVPDMSAEEKARVKDEAKCLLVYTYFQAFRYFGGLPIIKFAFTGSESGYEGRKSAKETVDFMLGLLDEVITAKSLPWAYDGAEAASETGHWTLAGAMALKIQILQFAASPLLNSEQPYYAGKYTMEHPEYVWFGGYDATLWTKLKEACDDFFNTMASRGHYHLVVPAGDTQEDYAYAYRSSYMHLDSPEIIHSCRVGNNALDNDYRWVMLGFGNKGCGVTGAPNDRCCYNPTQEYVEMFPWADGTPFDWAQTEKDGKLDEMFIKGDRVKGQRDLQNVKYTRDPRLYENAAVNGQRAAINWGGGNRSGQYYEAYVGGETAGLNPATNTGPWNTGYLNLKYLAGKEFQRKWPQWSPLLLSDMYLTYAEAIIKSGGSCTDALKYVDAVRARVGLKGLDECNPTKNLKSNKDNLLEEILRERACDLALQNVRYFDLIRYKRAEVFEKKLHGLRMYRIGELEDGTMGRIQLPWWSGDRTNNALTEDDYNFYEPNHFEYERFEITTGARYWWTNGFDPKWYFQPFPITEVNKGYGLDQNPGW